MTIETFLETASGRQYHFLDPQQDEICIEDIAFALSNKCRFSGHTQFYSVAEHSIAVSMRLPKHLRLAGLLHDAAEAYLGDIPSPLKACLPDFKKIEDVNERVIFEKFNIELTLAQWCEVKQADLQALYNEAAILLPSGGKTWSMFQQGVWKTDSIYPLCMWPEDAFKKFMYAYHVLVDDKQMEMFT
jgi:hypothetical protein